MASILHTACSVEESIHLFSISNFSFFVIGRFLPIFVLHQLSNHLTLADADLKYVIWVKF